MQEELQQKRYQVEALKRRAHLRVIIHKAIKEREQLKRMDEYLTTVDTSNTT